MSETSVAVKAVLAVAAHEAEGLGSAGIETEHVVLGLLKVEGLRELTPAQASGLDDADVRALRLEAQGLAESLEAGGLDAKRARRRLRALWREAHPDRRPFSAHRTPRCRQVFVEASASGSGTIGLRALMLAAIESQSELLNRLLSDLQVSRERLSAALRGGGGKDNVAAEAPPEKPARKEPSQPSAEERPPQQPKSSEAARFGRDLTRLAREGKLQPAIGRDQETKRVARILLQAKKSNPILVGDAGVGKTAIVEGLAVKLAGPQAPAGLREAQIVELSLGALVAGTKHRGDFEERLQRIVREGQQQRDLVLFIDELHMLLGAGAAGGAMDAANLLKPALARGTLRVIGATTTDEYRKHIEKDPALERRFQVVWVEEPDRQTAVAMIEGLRPTLEAHHGVKIARAAIEKAVDLSIRYLPDFRLPDKAIDLLDQACARCLLATFSPVPARPAGSPAPEVGPEEIASVVAERCRVPMERLTAEEGERLLQMEETLGRRVLGQPHALREVAQAIRTARAGLKDPRKPVGVFLFVGPSGTGKTELAKALAEFLFDDERRLIRIDMSEYAEKHSVAKLIGSPPGYVGHDEGGQLTDAIRSHPYSVVLFDEIEKAHPDVFDLFLQVFDEGRLTDSRGRSASFSESVIILTSNLGAPGRAERGARRQLVNRIEREARHTRSVSDALRPELLNRIQRIVEFQGLGEDVVRQIIDKTVRALCERLRERRVELALDPSAYAVLMKHGFAPELGAREMERAVDRLLVQPLASALLEGRVKEGTRVLVAGYGDALSLECG